MEKDLNAQELAKQDTILLPGVSELREDLQDYLNKLGERLNELVIKDEHLTDPDNLAWMATYVAETRSFLSALMEDLKE